MHSFFKKARMLCLRDFYICPPVVLLLPRQGSNYLQCYLQIPESCVKCWTLNIMLCLETNQNLVLRLHVFVDNHSKRVALFRDVAASQPTHFRHFSCWVCVISHCRTPYVELSETREGKEGRGRKKGIMREGRKG
jgi:hypothetical protein